MNKQTIILVFFLFVAPVLVAILLHSEWIDWQPGGTRNHGELIRPVQPLPEFEVVDARGERLERADLLERWHLFHLRNRPCDETCLEDLYWLRQIRRAQDRHQPDVGLVLISASPVEPATLERIFELAEDFHVIDGTYAESLLQAFPAIEDTHAGYITDPMANIIMGYPADADPNGIRRDLRRLLTWTQRE